MFVSLCFLVRTRKGDPPWTRERELGSTANAFLALFLGSLTKGKGLDIRENMQKLAYYEACVNNSRLYRTCNSLFSEKNMEVEK